MNDKTEWSFSDHDGNPISVWASDEREACAKANEEADRRDAIAQELEAHIYETYDKVFSRPSHANYSTRQSAIIPEDEMDLIAKYGSGLAETSYQRNGVHVIMMNESKRRKGSIGLAGLLVVLLCLMCSLCYMAAYDAVISISGPLIP